MFNLEKAAKRFFDKTAFNFKNGNFGSYCMPTSDSF